MNLWKLIPNHLANWRNRESLRRLASTHRVCPACNACHGNLGRTVDPLIPTCPKCGHASCPRKRVVA